MDSLDYLVVGAGLTGVTMARLLADSGARVLVVDRRDHLGGNVHDYEHESGIRVHAYGPHYFRTRSEEIWGFVNRFAEFYPYEACVMTHVSGTHEHWPIAASYIRRTVGENWMPAFTGTPSNFEEAALSMMPWHVYELFVKEYTEKQWGVPAFRLSADLCRRFDVRQDDDPRLTPHAKYQGLPVRGYAAMIRSMLQGIPTMLDVDYLHNREQFRPRKKVIFTGGIDEFFDFRLGRLKYRGQQRITEYRPDVERHQVAAQVNEPAHAAGYYIRTLEWKSMMQAEAARAIRGTLITREIPYTPDAPNHNEYPFPDEANRELYRRYSDLAAKDAGVLICGRLGEYRYYDMDHAIARAMTLAKRLLAGEPAETLRRVQE